MHIKVAIVNSPLKPKSESAQGHSVGKGFICWWLFFFFPEVLVVLLTAGFPLSEAATNQSLESGEERQQKQ